MPLGLAAGWLAMSAGVIIVFIVLAVLASRRRRARLAPWRKLNNGMTADEVTALLGAPRNVVQLDLGESWDYGRRPHDATVIFTDGKVTGYIKPF